MRVSTDTELLDLAPGKAADITLDIVNNGEVIEGITARVIGLPKQHVTSRPAVLPLFPDSSGQLTLNIGLPSSFPAGRHPLTVEVHSRDIKIPPSYVDLDLVVPRRPALRLSPQPQIIRARRQARFTLVLVNDGNTPLNVTLQGSDADRAVDVRFSPEYVRLPAGSTAEVLVSTRGPRMIFGTDLDRNITVVGTARPLAASGSARAGLVTGLVELPPPGQVETPGRSRRKQQIIPPVELTPPDTELSDVPADETVATTTSLTFRQRPWFTRGILTALILLSIIALWAAVFLFGISSVFAQDPFTKSVPASFYPAVASAPAAAPTAGANGSTDNPAPGTAGGEGAGSGDGGTGGAAVVAPPPAGAMPKEGAMPAGLGGVLSGTVTAKSNGQPVGRILVEAMRQLRDGGWKAVASAATQADGTYSIAGLVPTDYAVRFTAQGFKPIFHGGATTVDAATPAAAVAGEITAGVDVVIEGDPASITGTIDPGDTLQEVISTVTVRPLQGSGPGNPVAKVKTKADGSYTIKDLPAPGTYELTFSAKGYLPTLSTVSVDGGSKRINPEVLLNSGAGFISGLVKDGDQLLGGVTVTTTVNGEELETGTPTDSKIGSFILTDLPTPATYVLTFTADGYATETMVVDLMPGEPKEDVAVQMNGGTGTVVGKLTDGDGNGLGGAVVTVGGAENAPSTITLTAGDIGSFQLTGLVSPGSYTLTFTLPGYANQTVPVDLETNQQPAPVAVTMATALGEITGVVTDSDGKPIVGANVTASDGRQIFPVFSTAAIAGSPAGGYTIANLPAGVYTVTAARAATAGTTNPGITAVITVTAGAEPVQNFILPDVAGSQNISTGAG